MRRLNGDGGAVAVLVALLSLVLFGVGALVIDVGMLYAERRELQNGADAGALAIATDCGAGTCQLPSAARTTAVDYATSNALDTTAAVSSVCSNESTLRNGVDVTACALGGPLQAKLDALDAAGARYVAVTTSTATDTGTLLPPALSGVLGNTGTQVRATSVAAWGGESVSGSTIPLIISACEWELRTSNGTSYAPLPPYTATTTPWAHETAIITHDPNSSQVVPSGVADCRSGGGFNYDIAGGFGWLQVNDTDSPCQAKITEVDTAASKQGAGAKCIAGVVRALMDSGTPARIPIYTQEPVNKVYVISGWARFYITGFHIGNDAAYTAGKTPVPSCITTSSQNCLTGFFLEPLPTSGIPSGASFGATVVSLIH